MSGDRPSVVETIKAQEREKSAAPVASTSAPGPSASSTDLAALWAKISELEPTCTSLADVPGHLMQLTLVQNKSMQMIEDLQETISKQSGASSGNVDSASSATVDRQQQTIAEMAAIVGVMSQRLEKLSATISTLSSNSRAADSVDRLEKKIEEVLSSISKAPTSAPTPAPEGTETLKAAQEKSAAALRDAAKRLNHVRSETEALTRRMTWGAVGRVAAALIPVALMMAGLLSVVGLAGQAAGIGPVAAWTWERFAAADGWWKLPWALGGIAGFVGAGYLVIYGARLLWNRYQRW